jgi:hypothetical protein
MYHSGFERSYISTTKKNSIQLKTLDFLQQTITMNENAQLQMIKDSVLFALSSGLLRTNALQNVQHGC